VLAGSKSWAHARYFRFQLQLPADKQKLRSVIINHFSTSDIRAESDKQTTNEGALLSTSKCQHDLVINFHTPYLGQCLQSTLRLSRLKLEEHGKSKQTVVPILVQTPKTNTKTCIEKLNVINGIEVRKVTKSDKGK
jgi:hypothetical protein